MFKCKSCSNNDFVFLKKFYAWKKCNRLYSFNEIKESIDYLVDETIKKHFHNKTIGLIISKKNDKFILEYVNDDGIFLISYEVNELIGIK